MRKLSALLLIAIFVISTQTAVAAQSQTFHELWTKKVGTNGTLTAEAGGYVFTRADNGPITVSFVGTDYVDFGERTNVAGQSTKHFLVPMSRLALRANS